MLSVIATGYFNGLRQYSKQSVSWIASYITKPILIFTLVLAGYSVYGAVLGFALSPVIGLIIALYFAGLPKRVKPFSRKKILLFAIPVTVYTVLSQYITNIDLLLLKALTSFTDEIGYYSAASMISKVPVSLLAALNMAIFPAISETTYQNDVPRTQRYVSESLRYLLIFLLPSTLMIAISSDALVSLLYGQIYVEAGKPLSILIVGVFFFGLFAYFLNLIIASGKPRVATLMAAITLTFAVTFNFILIPPFGMVGAAFSTTLACLIGALISALYTCRLFGVLTSKQTFLKVLISALAVIPVFIVKLTGLLLLMQYGVAFLLYLAVLKITGELRKEDIVLIRGILK
jgi:O-antigen/teichoic acid export membrane protein